MYIFMQCAESKKQHRLQKILDLSNQTAGIVFELEMSYILTKIHTYVCM